MSYPHDDDIADVIASVEAILADSPEGMENLAAVLRHCNVYAVTVALAKLLAELVELNESGGALCSGCFRAWANQAGRSG